MSYILSSIDLGGQMRGVVSILLPLLGVACASVPMATEDWSTSTETSAQRIGRYGLWIDTGGLGIGFRSDELIRISSACQIVFLVSSDAQMEQAAALIKSEIGEGGEDICIEEF